MLVDLPLEKIPELCTILEKEWPQTINAIYFMRGLDTLKTGGNPCSEATLLYSQNNEQSGIIFIVEKGFERLFVSVFALDGYEEDLKTELMNYSDAWSTDKVVFLHTLEKHVRIVEEISATKNYHRILTQRDYGLIMPREHALNLSISCPEDVELRPLNENYLDQMYNTWVYKNEFSIQVFKKWYELDEKYAIGVFCKTSGALLSYCQRLKGRIINGYTLESAWGKGYDQLLMKKLSKLMAEDSLDVYCFVSNETALHTCCMIGFVHEYNQSSLSLRKNE